MEIIPVEIQDYAEAHSSPPGELLQDLYRQTHLRTLMPRMLSGPVQGKFLGMLARVSGAKTILEIGTFTGYSALSMGEMTADEVVIHTIEQNLELEAFIREYLQKAGMEKRILLHMGDARDVIKSLDIVPDLVFIDADKHHYCDYYELLVPRMKRGGIILVDNALWDGKVLQPEPKDRETQGIKAFNERVQQDERVDNVLLTIRDGLMMIVKK